ncbi:MAG TPA: phosphate ABC transporter substrate-binding protein [Candidatus Methylacidiphilales bacterium]
MKRILLSLLAVSALTVGAHAQKIVIKGSDTLGAKYVPQLAEAFKASHPGVSFEIAAEGSTTGISAIIDGTADIGMASRRAKDTEISAAQLNGVEMKPVIVALDGIGVVINAGNPVANLTKKQVEDIFTGAITDWSIVGGKPGKISIYTRNTSSGTYSEFKEMAMSKKDYAPTSQKLAGNEQIASEVGKNPNGIGYVGIAYVHAAGIKAVAVNGAPLTEASVQNHSWPYWRPTFYYTNGTPKGIVKDFVDFTTSAAGQAIGSKVGFVPINK